MADTRPVVQTEQVNIRCDAAFSRMLSAVATIERRGVSSLIRKTMTECAIRWVRFAYNNGVVSEGEYLDVIDRHGPPGEGDDGWSQIHRTNADMTELICERLPQLMAASMNTNNADDAWSDASVSRRISEESGASGGCMPQETGFVARRLVPPVMPSKA